MGKKAKEHRKKVARRNARMEEDNKKHRKAAMNHLMKLIQKEKEKGAFDNPIQPLPTNQIPTIAPTIDNSNFAGPQI